MSEFKLTRELGLKVIIPPWIPLDTTKYVRASDLEALLSKGVRVLGNSTMDKTHMCWLDYPPEQRHQKATHSALLISIKPIVRETAEDVLRDLNEYCLAMIHHGGAKYSLEQLGERARRVLNHTTK